MRYLDFYQIHWVLIVPFWNILKVRTDNSHKCGMMKLVHVEIISDISGSYG